MKTDLSPKYIERVGQSYLLWFNDSRSYVMLSEVNYKIFQQFLKSDSELDFCQFATSKLNLSPKDAQQLYHRFYNLNKKINFISKPTSQVRQSPTHNISPNSRISKYYRYRNSNIKVNYGSELIKELFHSPINHLELEHDHKADISFDILKEEENLLLFKNEKLIYNCPTGQYHFMQGQFAMELTNFIHNKSIGNWLASFHASTIVKNEEAIMIVGDSGNGKSTLTALSSLNGFELLADDFTPIYADDMKVYRFPNAISIKTGAFGIMENIITGFSHLPSFFNNNKHTTVKYYYPKFNQKSDVDSFKCYKIVYVKYSQTDSQFFGNSEASKILTTLIPDSWISPEDDHVKKFLSWLKTIQFYELTYNDNDFAISSIESLT